MRVTMKQIAAEAGVTPRVVSAVVNDDYSKIGVGKAKREIIGALIKKYDYRPNAVARSLRAGKSEVLNVIIPSAYFFQSYLNSSIISGIQERAEDAGYRLNFTSLYFKGKENYSLSGMVADGAMVFYWGEAHDRLVYEVERLGIPFVVANRYISRPDVNRFYFDVRRVMRGVTGRMLEKGHRRFAYAYANKGNMFSSIGVEGITAALDDAVGTAFREFSIRTRGSRKFTAAEQFAMGSAGLRTMLDSGFDPSLIIFGNDQAAMGALREAARLGIDVPGDVAVMGCGSEPFAELWETPLSTIDMKPQEYGRRLCGMMLDVIDSPDTGPLNEAFVPRAVYRASTEGTALSEQDVED